MCSFLSICAYLHLLSRLWSDVANSPNPSMQRSIACAASALLLLFSLFPPPFF
jgi:hypothetical protein